MVKEKEKYYNRGIEKQKLSLMKQSYGVSYNSQAPKEQKQIAQRLIKEQKQRVGQEEKIKKTEEKIREKSFLGRFKKGLGQAGERVEKALQKKVVSRRILRKSQATVTIPQKQIDNPLSEPNTFFTGAFEQEKRLFFK